MYVLLQGMSHRLGIQRTPPQESLKGHPARPWGRSLGPIFLGRISPRKPWLHEFKVQVPRRHFFVSTFHAVCCIDDLDMAPISQRKVLGRDKFGTQFSQLKTQQYTDPPTRTAIPTMYVPVLCRRRYSDHSLYCYEARTLLPHIG